MITSKIFLDHFSELFKSFEQFFSQCIKMNHLRHQNYMNKHQVRGVFLDVSKGFDKVWHKGIIFKLTQNGISSKLISVLPNFLKDN